MAHQTISRRVRIRKKKKYRKKTKFIIRRTTYNVVRVSKGKVVRRYYSARSIKRLTV